jgi:hypothetical protein
MDGIAIYGNCDMKVDAFVQFPVRIRLSRGSGLASLSRPDIDNLSSDMHSRFFSCP